MTVSGEQPCPDNHSSFRCTAANIERSVLEHENDEVVKTVLIGSGHGRVSSCIQHRLNASCQTRDALFRVSVGGLRTSHTSLDKARVD